MGVRELDTVGQVLVTQTQAPPAPSRRRFPRHPYPSFSAHPCPPTADGSTSDFPATRLSSARPRRIALVGIDGAGKTTQALLLAQALTAAGSPARYWRNAGGRRWLDRVAVRLGRPDARRMIGRGGLMFVEAMLRWLAIARAVVGSAGRIAVMDRYAVCQYASLRSHGADRWERFARIAYRVFPRPDVTFLLWLPPAEAQRRIEARGTDHESLEYLVRSAAAYRAFAEPAGFVVIDAQGDAAQVAAAIWQQLTDRLPVYGPTAPGSIH
jgi:dTMP kinase